MQQSFLLKKNGLLNLIQFFNILRHMFLFLLFADPKLLALAPQNNRQAGRNTIHLHGERDAK